MNNGKNNFSTFKINLCMKSCLSKDFFYFFKTNKSVNEIKKENVRTCDKTSLLTYYTVCNNYKIY